MKNEDISFAHDDHFGYLTTCPANIGTGLKYNIFIKLPHLTKDMRLPTLIKDLNLTMEEIMDPDPEAFKDCIDISNRDRIGKTEVCVFDLLNRIDFIIDILD
jgi:protein-arginine kinase